METRMKRILSTLLLLGMTHTLSACAGLQYSAAPIEAWVVDAETKQPIEGVIVVAHWALESTSRIIPHQTNATGSLMILETVTDKNGRFHFPAWGPKWHLGSGDLTDDDPELIFFKSGYKYINVSNSQYTRPIKYRDEGKPVGAESKPTGSKRISFWSGEKIEMERFGGTMGEYAKHLGLLNNNLYPLLGSEACDWQQVPRMLLALSEQSRAFRKQGIEALYDVDLYLPISEKRCGSPKAFFERYQP